MLIKFLVLFAAAAIAPQVLGGVKIKGLGTAALIALVFGVLNFFFGWALEPLLGLLTLPLSWITLGLAGLLVVPVANAILLKVTDAVIDGFEIEGLLPAFLMGVLFVPAGWLGDLGVAILT